MIILTQLSDNCVGFTVESNTKNQFELNFLLANRNGLGLLQCINSACRCILL